VAWTAPILSLPWAAAAQPAAASADAQSADASPPEAQPSEVEAKAAPPAEDEPPQRLSDAEGLLVIQRRAEADRARLRRLERDLVEVGRRFDARSKRFEALDAELTRLREAEADPAALPPGVAAEELPARIASLERTRGEARDALDTTIRRRQALIDLRDVLRREIELEEALLAILRGEIVLGEPAAGETPVPTPPGPTAEAPPRADAKSASDEAAPEPAAPSVEVFDQRVADARRELAERRKTLATLEQGAQIVDRAIGLNGRDLEATGALLELARDARARAEERRSAYVDELASLESEDAAAPRLAELRRDIARAEARVEEADAEIAELTRQAEMVEPMFANLRERSRSLDAEVAETRDEVASAERWLEFVSSPLAPHRILRGLISAAPRVGIALVLLGGLWLLARLLVRRFAHTYVTRGRGGTQPERADRADTLARVSRSLLDILFVVFGVLVLLDQFGVDVTVLLGGAAIFGVALAFGAQNLVQDYYFGFMILLENQYRVGNVVKIGDVSGVVEDITLRMTMLRDLEGVAHFIPHSQIKTVSNLTHRWSRAMLDIGVAYKEDVDRVIDVLKAVAGEMRSDPEFGPMILEDAEILGVDKLADSAVVIRMTVKTVPVRQWAVKRELLRRIKNRFDALGIEIPFPHRTVYHRTVEHGAAPPASATDAAGTAPASDTVDDG
jgi:small conductance mechanosensitive channel